MALPRTMRSTSCRTTQSPDMPFMQPFAPRGGDSAGLSAPARDWRDDFTLCSAALRVVPDSAKMHNGIAVQYASRGELDTARLEFEAVLGIYPNYPEALESFG